jgi:RNA polymerase sigma-70 factor, ECF subfamily
MAKELTIQIIRQAQAGNRQCLSAVSEQAQHKIYTYIYRLTLDYHLTQDLTQETVLEMIKSLDQLELSHINGFWAWVFRTALGKVQHHFRPQGARRLAQKTTSDPAALESQIAKHDSAMNAIIRKEVCNAVMEAMKTIKLTYRNILVLRCFDNLSYGQIAVILGGSELQARLLFFRAKRSLKSQLERHGFKRDSLLSILSIFAGLTSGTGKKAVAGEIVSASSLETGVGIGLVSLITAKTTLAVACVLIVAGFTVSKIKPDSTNTEREAFYSHVYSHLHPLLDLEEFVLPSRVIDVNDPDQDGLLVVEQTSPESSRQRLQADQITIDLANQPRMGPALPKGHWIELGFDGPIRDGSGPDLLLRVQGCRGLIRVFVTDGAGEIVELRRPQCWGRGVCRREHVLDFDLDGLDLPFAARAVRVLGAYNWGPYGGIRFYSAQARIQRERASQL